MGFSSVPPEQDRKARKERNCERVCYGERRRIEASDGMLNSIIRLLHSSSAFRSEPLRSKFED
jgi:hypothetical protein